MERRLEGGASKIEGSGGGDVSPSVAADCKTSAASGEASVTPTSDDRRAHLGVLLFFKVSCGDDLAAVGDTSVVRSLLDASSACLMS
mmetsp:Transcript_2009/g.12834  ORF Transcript_2009/g.12834 Transcript_2009/m.12834 type:complete len:87 (-) Transcript_2009:3267-3527(-)